MPNQSTALPSRRPHMDAGALRPMVGQFTDALIALGHTRFTVSAFYDSARHFADWACRSGIAPYEVNSGTIDSAHVTPYRPGVAGRRHMLSTGMMRYVELHRAVGFRFHTQHQLLSSFAAFADAHGDEFVRIASGIDLKSGSTAT